MPETTPSRPAITSNVRFPNSVRQARRPLRIDDLLHLPERRAAVEQFAGSRITGAAAQLRIVFQQMGGKPQRLFPQVHWRCGIVRKHRHDVLGFENGADAVSDRLAAVGRDHFNRYAEAVADELEQFAQPHRLHAVDELGGRADRQVDQKMGRARREFFRHDRSDHLLAGIEAERPLDGDQYVVGRRQVDVPAPDQTAIAGRNDGLHLIGADIDPCQYLHRVRRAGRRGNGARGGLRDRQTVSGHDRHHDHRGAIARNAADAMLVDHDRVGPFQLRSHARPWRG